MSRRTAWNGIRVAMYLAVLGYLVVQLVQTRQVVAGDLRRIGWLPLVVAGGLALAGTVPAMLGWRTLLSGLGTPLELPIAARVYFVAGLGKYLPGALWPAVSQADLAHSLGKPPWRFVGAFLASVALSVLAGALLGLPALAWLTDAGPAWRVAAVASAVGLAALSPRLLQVLFAVLGRFLTRLPAKSGRTSVLPENGAIARSFLLTALGWVVTGAHVAVLALPLGAHPTATPLLVAGYCLATVGGVLTVVLPAGLGAREVMLSLAAGAVLSGSVVLTLVVLSRFLVTIADLTAAAVAAGYALARRPAAG